MVTHKITTLANNGQCRMTILRIDGYLGAGQRSFESCHPIFANLVCGSRAY
jgi:hypothetical protein